MSSVEPQYRSASRPRSRGASGLFAPLMFAGLKFTVLIFTVAYLSPCLCSLAADDDGADSDAAGFTTIFDGRSLSGWRAVPKNTVGDWSVRDGVIVGIGSENRLSYLVWREEDLADFELKLSYRLRTPGNTGVEIRSRVDTTGKRPFEGYHADLGHVGIGPHILGAWDFHFAKRHEPGCQRGTKLIIDKSGQVHRTKIANALTAADVRKREWNDVHIIARGNHCQLYINGMLASEFVDKMEDKPLTSGAIGLQLHDKGMQVEFKNVRMKRLPGN